MNNSIYNEAKKLVKNQAKELKRTSDDKPYIRYELNNLCDSMCKQFEHYCMAGKLTEKQVKIYSNWLASFTGSLHP